MELLTNSRLSAADDCPRKEYWLYKEGLRTQREEEPLRVGTLVHMGLEAWLNATMVTDDQHQWLVEAVAAVAESGAYDEYEQVRVEEMLRGYHFRWKDVPMQVVAAEQEFRAPLLNPGSKTGKSRTFEIAGKIDGVLEGDLGQIILEHKTTSEAIDDPTTGYWQKLAMDSQVSMYYLGAESLGYEVEGCLYDVLKKPALRPLRATPEDKRKYRKDGLLYANQRLIDETPDEYRIRVREEIEGNPDKYYQRQEVHRLESQLLEFMFDAWTKGVAIRDMHRAAEQHGIHAVPRNPNACHRFGTCFLWDVCSAGLNPDEHPDRFKRVENVHPELSMCAAGEEKEGEEEW